MVLDRVQFFRGLLSSSGPRLPQPAHSGVSIGTLKDIAHEGLVEFGPRIKPAPGLDDGNSELCSGTLDMLQDIEDRT